MTEKRAGIVCCSNGLSMDRKEMLRQLTKVLEQAGVKPVYSNYIFAKNGVQSGTAKERAAALMEFYENPEIDMIFDISGGDIANEILPYLDYDIIAGAKDRNGQKKAFWGYSDLTVVLNAIYAKTGNPGVLYQVRNLTAEENADRRRQFRETIHKDDIKPDEEKKPDSLYSFGYKLLQGDNLSGVVVGGNIRCLLKLAGTEYFPDMQEKVLLLEAYSGLQPQLITYLNQLKQIGVFEQINGVLLGTFTQLENQTGQQADRRDIVELVKEAAGSKIPIVKTGDIGHGLDAKAIKIGEYIALS